MRGGARRGALPVGALVGLAMAVTACASAGADPSTGPVAAAARSAESRPAVPAPTAATAHRAGSLAPERPLTSRLPSGATVRIEAVATTRDGSLAVPADIRLAGWWRGGSRLGDPFGSTLLAAHVDSFTQGLGPYAELLSVLPGQVVALGSAHLRQSFRIVSLRLVPQGSLRHRQWIYSAGGPRRLTLVTCAGPYDAARGGYQRLAVVSARPTGPATRGALE